GACSFGDARRNSQIVKRTIVIVAVNRKILAVEIGDEQILPTVIIEISRVHHAPALPQMRRNSRRFGNVSERSVAIVVKQPIRHRLINLWNAIMPSTVLMN